ncbi:hypothetical protein BDZ45DRAFT_812339 [Acephala macrosclerotiorum]|nr:hypothetical protein BDZ45DRAFT_812339 [Acephala macrosclerotiorum]
MPTLPEYMQINFANVQSGTEYEIEEGTEDQTYNCFSYAVGVTSERILPDTWDTLDDSYAALGFFAVKDLGSALEDNDVEIYAKPTDPDRPLHAHRVISAASGACRSKMGADCIIRHNRSLLQCGTRNDPSRYTFGTVVARYRYSAEKLKTWQEKDVITRSGRRIKGKDAKITTSGRPIRKTDAKKSKSGRIYKTGQGSKAGKSRS